MLAESYEQSPVVTPPTVVATEPQEIPAQRPDFLAREIVETIILTLFIFWMVNTVTGRFRIEGHSMEPTLHEGEYVLINKLSYYLDEPQRGDIIVLKFPNDESRDFIKRIIGIPGDHIEIGDGQVKVNGVTLEEPYIKAPPNYSGSWIVPADNFFVLGDNRNNSHDSHSWSFLPRRDVLGKAWLIYWGPSDWGLVPHYPHPIG
ncbi:MAG: signal peptidase I [Anaerolineales bacterium]|nr:signal peptidase I [Anaerolineales bacterium]MCB8950480.1 signal peptidase I [Ardenticatenales bacterium]